MAEQSSKLKIAFMGTPDFAATILHAIADWDGGDVVCAYTQPDRPCGRGQECKPPAVKIAAREHDIPVRQPLNFKDQADVDALRGLDADVAVVAAYGLILPQVVLDVPEHGCINVHASLLPKYRGAAPIQRAIMNGDRLTGVTIMQMEAGLDTGPMLLQRSMGIDINDTAATLHDDLAKLGASLIIDALERLKAGTLAGIPQNDALSTYAPKLAKTEGEVDFARSAQDVHNQIRGVFPWPGAYSFVVPGTGKSIRVGLEPGRIGEPLSEEQAELPSGTLVGEVDGDLAFTCADKLYLVPCVRPQNKKPMDARAFVCGYLNRC